MNFVAGALLEVHVSGGEMPAESEVMDESRVEELARSAEETQLTPHRARKAQRAVFWLVTALCDPAPRKSCNGDNHQPLRNVLEQQPGAPLRSSLIGKQSAPRRQSFDNCLELCELWRPGMPQLKLRVFQFDHLLGQHMPKLRKHFRNIGMAPDVLASQWFFTLFAYALPAHWLPRVWDVVFADGWKAMMRFALGRLALSADELLGYGLEDMGKYMRDRTRLERRASELARVCDGVEVLLEASFKFKVTRTTLAELTEQFGVALLEERCREPSFGGAEGDLSSALEDSDSWLRRYGGHVDDILADAPARALRSRLAELDDITRKDAAALRARVERIERDGADARTRLEKATAALRDKRRLVGELVDAKRLAAADAARLVLALSDDEDDDFVVDSFSSEERFPSSLSLKQPQAEQPPSLWRRIRDKKPLRFLGRTPHRRLASSPPRPRVSIPRVVSPFTASCLTIDDDDTIIRDELRATQLRATKVEKDLRVAREKLAAAARDFVIAQADLDEAAERKRAVEIQLVHVVNDATARRRGVLAEVVQSNNTPDLNLVRRFSSHQVRRNRSDGQRSADARHIIPEKPLAIKRRVQSDIA